MQAANQMKKKEKPQLEQLKKEISKLPEEYKSELLRWLMEEVGSNRQIILGGGNFISAKNVFQIQGADVSDVMRAVADLVDKEKPFTPHSPPDGNSDN